MICSYVSLVVVTHHFELCFELCFSGLDLGSFSLCLLFLPFSFSFTGCFVGPGSCVENHYRAAQCFLDWLIIMIGPGGLLLVVPTPNSFQRILVLDMVVLRIIIEYNSFKGF